MSAWVAVLAAGAVSYLIRVLPVAVLSSRTPPPWLDRVGVLAAPVAFAALLAATVASSAEGGADELVPRLLAIVVAAAVAHRTRSTTWTVVSGMVVLWLGSAASAAVLAN